MNPPARSRAGVWHYCPWCWSQSQGRMRKANRQLHPSNTRSGPSPDQHTLAHRHPANIFSIHAEAPCHAGGTDCSWGLPKLHYHGDLRSCLITLSHQTHTSSGGVTSFFSCLSSLLPSSPWCSNFSFHNILQASMVPAGLPTVAAVTQAPFFRIASHPCFCWTSSPCCTWQLQWELCRGCSGTTAITSDHLY